MFMGEYVHVIDSKGRLIVPSRFREGLGDRFVATRGLDSCLFLFPKPEWDLLETRLKALPLSRPEARAFTRFLFAGAHECELDRQGRILLPPLLREYAGLEKEAVFIGVGNRVEVWEKERWEKYRQQAAQTYEQVAEKLVDFGV
ncbi:MAG: division/cell wall cluster transcriptional repressor MraZ [Clostridia bacterium]|nr:division/cell wall cluster transcriptional repressor MraZ [Clostridia bacterium]